MYCSLTYYPFTGRKPEKTRRRWHKRSLRNSPWLKVGHGGTLDKSAEGVLVVGIGDDCKKLSTYLHSVDKSYTVTGRLGIATDTLDGSGEVTEERSCDHVMKEDLAKTLVDFEGEISQVPPLYSALKHGGKRFSDRAREAAGQGASCDITPEPRQVTIHSIRLTEFNSPHFTIEVSCGSGTYMRSLIRDIGSKLGTVAHTEHLVRTQHGPFCLEDALPESKWTLSDISSAIERCSSKITKKVTL